ncbi:MAG: porin, partial [Pseudomonadota bacterium]
GVGVVYPAGSYLNYYDSTGDVLPGHPGGFLGEDDAIGIHYTTPTVAGFTAGVTWQPDPDADGAGDSNNLVTAPDGEEDNQFAVGANYTGEFSGVSYAVGGGYFGNDALDAWHAGAEIGYAGVTAAGFYNRSEEDAVIGGEETDTYGLGAQYDAGPWTLGVGYSRQEIDGAAPGAPEERDFVHVGAAWDLAPGVTTYSAVQWGEDDPGEDGMGVFGWLELRF